MSADSTNDPVFQVLLRREELLQQGRDVPLEELCADHPELIGEVRRMIGALGALDPPVDSAPSTTHDLGGAAARADDGRPGPMPTERYEVQGPLGQGGLGVVSRARDVLLQREVALKRIQPQRARDPRTRRRFLREAEVTGRLEHPSIVPIHDLGWGDDGQPYYVMRLVRGEGLDKAIARWHQRGPGLEDPVELRRLLGHFVAVCHAIAYAHGRGVVHRDIKPANIMLGSYGETHVVDWGLARFVGETEEGPVDIARPTDPDAVTVPGTVLGSPGYMSPEQAAGKRAEVDATSDVYSLGATLYTLLTGRVPPRASSGDLVPAVVIPPPRSVRPLVPRALEAICLKAMAADRSQRYASAKDLGEDVRRWLDDAPVSAYREPWTKRLARFASRHRPLVAGLGVALALVPLGLALLAFNQARANQQLRAREELASRSIAVYRQAVEDNLDVRARPELVPLRKAMLQPPLDFYRDLRRLVLDRGATDPTDLARLAEASYTLARITEQIDTSDRATEAYREALDTLRPLLSSTRPLPEIEVASANCLSQLALLQLGEGQAAEARASLAQAQDLARRAVARRGAPEDRSALARSLSHLGNVELQEALRNILITNAPGGASAAQRAYEQAAEVLGPLVREHPDRADFALDLARCELNLATSQFTPATAGAALAALESARATLQTMLERPRPRAVSARARAELAKCQTNIGNVLSLTAFPARADDAFASYSRAADLLGTLASEDPAVIAYRADRAACLNNLGLLQHRASKLDEALATFADAEKVQADLLASAPTDTNRLLEFSRTIQNETNLLREQAGLDPARDETALTWFDQTNTRLAAISGFAARPDVERLLRRGLLTGRAESLARLRRFDEALAAWSGVVELAEGPDLIAARVGRAQTLARAGRLDEARTVAREVAENSDLDALAHYNLACLHGLIAEAEDPGEGRSQAVEEALSRLKKALAAGFNDVAQIEKDADLKVVRESARFREVVPEGPK